MALVNIQSKHQHSQIFELDMFFSSTWYKVAMFCRPFVIYFQLRNRIVVTQNIFREIDYNRLVYIDFETSPCCPNWFFEQVHMRRIFGIIIPTAYTIPICLNDIRSLLSILYAIMIYKLPTNKFIKIPDKACNASYFSCPWSHSSDTQSLHIELWNTHCHSLSLPIKDRFR